MTMYSRLLTRLLVAAIASANLRIAASAAESWGRMTRPEQGSPPYWLVVLSQDADSTVGAATHPNPIRAVSTTSGRTFAAATDTGSAPVVGAERGSLRLTVVGGAVGHGDDGKPNTAATVA